MAVSWKGGRFRKKFIGTTPTYFHPRICLQTPCIILNYEGSTRDTKDVIPEEMSKFCRK